MMGDAAPTIHCLKDCKSNVVFLQNGMRNFHLNASLQRCWPDQLLISLSSTFLTGQFTVTALLDGLLRPMLP